MKIEIVKADYLDKIQAQDISFLMNAYATDSMGGGKPLPEKVLKNLVQELSIRPYAFTILSYVDNKVTGLVTCFETFSTFKCQPLINIHDVIVLNEYRERSGS